MKYAVAVSRPWFWLYLAGPFLVGYTAGMSTPSQYLNAFFWLGLAYFTYPANMYLYGFNDLFDADTDKHNEKKDKAEHRLQDKERLTVSSIVGLSGLLGAAGVFAGGIAAYAMAAFLVLGYAYSAPPFRLKAVPFLDSVSNVLYITPAIYGYFLAGGESISIVAVGGAALWTMAMHLFSAIPDIEADASADVRTSATVLGRRQSLYVCAALWMASACLLTVFDPLLAVALVYPALSFFALTLDDLSRLYWYYPYINAAMGFASYIFVAAPHLP